MDLIQAIVLGIIQGITEWLPVSSKAQLTMVAYNFFGTSTETAFKNAVFLHIGTLIAAAAFFRKDLANIVKEKDKPLAKFVLTGLVGAAITGIPIYLLFRGIISDAGILMPIIGIALILTGIMQFKKRIAVPREDIGHGFLTGLAQGIAVIPGISRSGITTAALLLEDYDPKEAFRLSFILSIPSVFFAEILFSALEGIDFSWNILVGIIVAAIVGYLTIDALLVVAKKVNFGWFCIAFGLVYVVLAII